MVFVVKSVVDTTKFVAYLFESSGLTWLTAKDDFKEKWTTENIKMTPKF